MGTTLDAYGRCDDIGLAKALSELFDFEHPLVDGVEERRTEAFTRIGYRPTG